MTDFSGIIRGFLFLALAAAAAQTPAGSTRSPGFAGWVSLTAGPRVDARMADDGMFPRCFARSRGMGRLG